MKKIKILNNSKKKSLRIMGVVNVSLPFFCFVYQHFALKKPSDWSKSAKYLNEKGKDVIKKNSASFLMPNL